MVLALSTPKGQKVPGMKNNEKSRITSRFMLVTRDGVQSIIGKQSQKPVLKLSKAEEVLKQHHDQARHPGRVTVLSTIGDTYHSFPRSLVESYIKACQKCAARQPLPKPPVGKAIRAPGPMVRIQADLIDMRSTPDGDFRYILQVKDHMSKFVWPFPLQRKECSVVCAKLKEIFRMFGPPRVLQTDNGGELTGKEMRELMDDFKCTKLIHGRARHPQTQGLVERANQTLENRLGAWIQDNGRDGWAAALPHLAFSVNRSYCRVTQTSPFQLMFARKARDPHCMDPTDQDDILSDEEQGEPEPLLQQGVPENVPEPLLQQGVPENVPEPLLQQGVPENVPEPLLQQGVPENVPEPLLQQGVPENVPEPLLQQGVPENVPEPLLQQGVPENVPEPLLQQGVPENVPEPLLQQGVPENVPEPLLQQGVPDAYNCIHVVNRQSIFN